MMHRDIETVKKMIGLAENRFELLKQEIDKINFDDDASLSDCRISVSDVITPLNLALKGLKT